MEQLKLNRLTSSLNQELHPTLPKEPRDTKESLFLTTKEMLPQEPDRPAKPSALPPLNFEEKIELAYLQQLR